MIESRKDTDRLFYRLSEGEPSSPLGNVDIWCLHGSVGSAADWEEIALEFQKKGAEVRALNLWRFLKDGGLPIQQFAKELAREGERSGRAGRKKVLVAYSMGGRLALHALIESRLWDAAIIISANPGITREEDRIKRKASDAGWALKAMTMNWTEFLSEWDRQGGGMLGSSMRSDQDGMELIHARRQIAQSFIDWSVGAQENLWPKLYEIEVPILWVAGEADDKFCKIADRACRLLPNSLKKIAEKSGHRVIWEAPDWFLNESTQWLESLDHG